MPYIPERIYVDQAGLHTRFCRRILSQFPQTETIVIDDAKRSLPTYRDDGPIRRKKSLYLKYFAADAFKLCPGFSKKVLCCNYCVLDLVENCPLDCTYCILQAFLNRSTITLHVNVEELVGKMMKTIGESPRRPFRVGTGEHSDSLALDSIFQVNPYLVENFSKVENATLELKTKSDAISPLLGLRHNDNTVIAWSLNPHEIVKRHESKSAPLGNRLRAAQKVMEDGYRVAFHFDPIIYYTDWEKGYREVVEMLFDMIPARKIAWISLGTLRYMPILKQIAEERFPSLSLFSNEFAAAHDGKMRYLKPIRKKLVGSLSAWIREKSPEVPLYICMEKHSVWERTMTAHPKNAEELESYLSTVR